jgi:23S rRNA (uracil1939-C5)-methyltransferase
MLKKNDVLDLKIESMTNLGFGVAHHLGLVIFVSGAVTKERVLAKIIKLSSSYAVARMERILEPSPYRTDARCEYTKCHSCAYKNVLYSEECKIKENDVREAFHKEGLSVTVMPLVKSPKEKEYRNKAQYPIRLVGGEYTVGYFAPKSHRVCEARYCPLTPRVFGEICDVLCEYFKENSVSVYDENRESGLLRHVYIRRGEISGEIVLTIVINGKELPREDCLVRKITEKFSSVVGILINENERDTNVVLGEKYRTVFGRDFLYDTLAGTELKIMPAAFYQVNHGAAELLYAKARELAALEKSDTLLDLYCGTGSIGLSMAADCRELFGVDIVEASILCAKENARRAGIENAHFFTSNADRTEEILSEAQAVLGRKISPDVIILDPPRSGCGERAVQFVASLNSKRIVYISCNPTTLARDVKAFCELGYEYGELTPFDLFPQTGHVESVVCLKRQIQQ